MQESTKSGETSKDSVVPKEFVAPFILVTSLFALWGFAAICMDRGQVEDAVRYYRMAIESGPENSKLQQDYQDALRRVKK